MFTCCCTSLIFLLLGDSSCWKVIFWSLVDILFCSDIVKSAREIHNIYYYTMRGMRMSFSIILHVNKASKTNSVLQIRAGAICMYMWMYRVP